MNELDQLLNSFENDEQDDCAWMYYGDVDPEDAKAELAALRTALETAEQERERMKTKLIIVSKWFERQARNCEKQSKDTRFKIISDAAKLDAKNYQTMADDILAALNGGEA